MGATHAARTIQAIPQWAIDAQRNAPKGGPLEKALNERRAALKAAADRPVDAAWLRTMSHKYGFALPSEAWDATNPRPPTAPPSYGDGEGKLPVLIVADESPPSPDPDTWPEPSGDTF